MLSSFNITNLKSASSEILKMGEKWLQNPGPVSLKLLNRVFPLLIPFNAPHGFQLKSVGENEVRTALPFKRVNQNHVRGMHACAIATLGEFSAGILLIRAFSIGKFRLILSKLEVEYFFQGKTDLFGEVYLTDEEKERTQKDLEDQGLSVITLSTQIRDREKNTVAMVRSTWQLKIWEKVKTKV